MQLNVFFNQRNFTEIFINNNYYLKKEKRLLDTVNTYNITQKY